MDNLKYIYHVGTLLLSVLFKDSCEYKKMDKNEVISKLKFISKINKGEKINTRYMFVQQDDLPTKISRTFFNKDNRVNALSFIKNTIDNSFELIRAYSRSEHLFEREMCINILRDLKLAKNGIVNLKDTYITDIKFCCDMDTLLQDIDAKLNELTVNED